MPAPGSVYETSSTLFSMSYRIRKRILQIPSARSGRNWLKKVKFRKHDNISLYRFLKIFFYNIDEDEIMDRSYGVAFNFILAIFPTIIFLFTLIPYMPISNQFMNQLFGLIRDVIPGEKNNQVIIGFLEDFIKIPRHGLLSLGFLLALFYSSSAMRGIMRSFDKNYIGFKKRTGFQERKEALKRTSSAAEITMKSISMIHRAEKAIRISIGAGSTSVNTPRN